MLEVMIPNLEKLHADLKENAQNQEEYVLPTPRPSDPPIHRLTD